ncbi:uncharacterized protein [Watersipora subatra]|uniref:uncharacterized protein n=1 Tax=Watersipora subatra TaxID=2589382 RepID=UPI00355B032A
MNSQSSIPTEIQRSAIHATTSKWDTSLRHRTTTEVLKTRLTTPLFVQLTSDFYPETSESRQEATTILEPSTFVNLETTTDIDADGRSSVNSQTISYTEMSFSTVSTIIRGRVTSQINHITTKSGEISPTATTTEQVVSNINSETSEMRQQELTTWTSADPIQDHTTISEPSALTTDQTLTDGDVGFRSSIASQSTTRTEIWTSVSYATTSRWDTSSIDYTITESRTTRPTTPPSVQFTSDFYPKTYLPLQEKATTILQPSTSVNGETTSDIDADARLSVNS